MKVKINDNLFDVKTLLTTKDAQNGMMGKKFDGFDGMLFFMKNEPHSFWMKNCVVHLDIIFINGNEIIKIHHNCKPCFTDECESYRGDGDLILELPGGTCKEYNIKEGNQIDLL
jgi:uncharacterized membrane protein (UPF0127 family)